MGTDVALNGTGQQNLQHAQLAPGITYGDIPLDHPDRNARRQPGSSTRAHSFLLNQLPRGLYGNAGRNIVSGPALNKPISR